MAETPTERSSGRQAAKSKKLRLRAENEDLQRELCGWRCLAGLADRTMRGESFASIMNESVRACAENLRTGLAALLVLNEDGGHLEVAASVGLDLRRAGKIDLAGTDDLLNLAKRILPGWASAPGILAEDGGARWPRAHWALLEFQGLPLGVQCVARPSDQPAFTAGEAALIRGLACQAAIATFLHGPARTMVSRERTERDIHFAHALKARLLPSHAPDIPGHRLEVRFLESLDGGGDYYDHIALTGGRFAFVIGEISGRGSQAALGMAHILANLRGSLAAGAGLTGAVETLNRALVRRGLRGQMSSLVLGEIDPAAGKLTLASVGSTAIHHVAEDAVRPLHIGSGTPLGVLEACTVEPRVIDLTPGAAIVCTTDGLNKCHSENGSPLCGECLRAALAQVRDETGPETPLAQAIASHVVENSHPEVLSDDLTILSLECLA